MMPIADEIELEPLTPAQPAGKPLLRPALSPLGSVKVRLSVRVGGTHGSARPRSTSLDSAVQHAGLGLTGCAIDGIEAALAIDPGLEIARFQLARCCCSCAMSLRGPRSTWHGSMPAAT